MRDDDIDPTNAGGTQPGEREDPAQENTPTPDIAPPPEVLKPEEDVTPEEFEAARRAYLLKRFWISARGYWTRRGDKLAWPLSIGLLALIGLNVCFQYGINVWNRGLFDAIEKRDAPTVYFLGALFPPLVLGSVALVTIQVYMRMKMQRRWRSWLTKALIGRWLASGRYYQLNLIGGDHKNPEARISEDMRIATESPSTSSPASSRPSFRLRPSSWCSG